LKKLFSGAKESAGAPLTAKAMRAAWVSYQTPRAANKFLWVWHLKRGELPRAAR